MNTHELKDLNITPVFLWFPRFVEGKFRWLTTVRRYRTRYPYTEQSWEYILPSTAEEDNHGTNTKEANP